jgi:VCBS repeat protein/FG-GAP repeat protein
MRNVEQTGLRWAMILALAAATPLAAQDILINQGGADPILKSSTGAALGTSLDQASIGGGDTRKDLIIGSPGWNSSRGQVAVLIAGSSPKGTVDIATAADILFNGTVVGGAFGFATAGGNIFTSSVTAPTAERDLVVAAPTVNPVTDPGRVYVFAAPFARGTHTASEAIITLQGAPGEGFGSAVATLDVNGDGFREVIVGASVGGHIYVFNLQGRVAGATLQSSDANMIIDADPDSLGLGFGEVLEAGGDITGDGAADLAIGSPRANGFRGKVQVVRGHNLAEGFVFPGRVQASAAACLTLTGVDVGDLAGQSLAFKDVVENDTAGIRDLIIGAPGGDGPPGLTRTDSGEVYVLWGGNLAPGCDVHAPGAHCVRSLATPDVVFYGVGAGYRTGDRIGGGDVNRDNPDDLVFLAPGGPSGAELQVVYGTRTRAAYGTARDLATPGVIDRRVIGTELKTVLVYEVTGEGANDIVTGAPGSDAGGLVYVTVSPKIQLSTRAMTFSASQCATPSALVNISNPSVVTVPWVTQPHASWLQSTPATGASMLNSSTSAHIVAVTAGLAPGIYSSTIDVVSTTKHVVMFLTITVNLTVTTSGPRAATGSNDFTGDGCADIGVFRGTTGTWFVPRHGTVQFGTIGDVPVPGDYDGSHVAQPAVYRPSTGQWFLSSGLTVQWGVPGDVPVPADYDGDGKTDIAVYRPANGTWFILGQTPIVFGGPGEVPVPADYNGDGRADIAVYTRASGLWRIRNQGNVVWGGPTDVPVPADYNGDGIADIAVYRRSNGTWFVRSQFITQFGAPDDIPVPMDTNRDGRAELAVYRRSSGTWFVYDTQTTLLVATAWGQSGDTPIIHPWQVAATAPADMNGDGRTDVTVWRPGTGVWFTLQSPNGAPSSVGWGSGAAKDLPVAADYDGDGKTDVAVYRGSTGVWLINRSSTNTLMQLPWGSPSSGDIPVPGDYDGDHKADVAVYRASTGQWLINRSSDGTLMQVTWGTPAFGDIPVPGDFDGDGRADIAIYRGTTGEWFVLRSSDGSLLHVTFGAPSEHDIPVVGDYDADGRSDITVWRPGTGTWFVLTSGSEFSSFFGAVWGAGSLTDTPVVGDFDGDGQDDFAVWRSSTGTWFANLSSTHGLLAVQWGVSSLNDTPIGRAVR